MGTETHRSKPRMVVIMDRYYQFEVERHGRTFTFPLMDGMDRPYKELVRCVERLRNCKVLKVLDFESGSELKEDDPIFPVKEEFTPELGIISLADVKSFKEAVDKIINSTSA